MQIGEPLRIIIVEPLELPLHEPTPTDPEPIPALEPEPQQVPSVRAASVTVMIVLGIESDYPIVRKKIDKSLQMLVETEKKVDQVREQSEP